MPRRAAELISQRSLPLISCQPQCSVRASVAIWGKLKRPEDVESIGQACPGLCCCCCCCWRLGLSLGAWCWRQRQRAATSSTCCREPPPARSAMPRRPTFTNWRMLPLPRPLSRSLSPAVFTYEARPGGRRVIQWRAAKARGSRRSQQTLPMLSCTTGRVTIPLPATTTTTTTTSQYHPVGCPHLNQSVWLRADTGVPRLRRASFLWVKEDGLAAGIKADVAYRSVTRGSSRHLTDRLTLVGSARDPLRTRRGLTHWGGLCYCSCCGEPPGSVGVGRV